MERASASIQRGSKRPFGMDWIGSRSTFAGEGPDWNEIELDSIGSTLKSY